MHANLLFDVLMPNSHNERIASYIERRWPQRFPEFCAALRRYPLPISSGAAGTQLHGSCPEAVRATEAFCAMLAPRHGREVLGDDNSTNDEMLARDGEVSVAALRRSVSFPFSPFRCFKMRRTEGGPPLLSGQPAVWSGNSDWHFGQLHNSRGEAGTSLMHSSTTGCQSGEPLPEEKLSWRELRDRCLSKGLLGSGTKVHLIARLRKHGASKLAETSPKPRYVPDSQAEVLSHLREDSERCSRSMSSAGHTSTVSDMIRHGQRLRTLFRSPNTDIAPTTSLAEGGSEPQGRLLGTPKEFVASQQRERKLVHSTPSMPTNTTDIDADENETPKEEGCSNNYSWHLLVDNRERIKGAHENLIEVCSRAGAPSVSCTLPCGDFMIGINSPNVGCSANSANVPDYQCRNAAGCTVLREGAMYGQTQKISFLVVERKTVKDLCASITSSRYYEQRQLLSSSPFRSVVWVVEGTMESITVEERRRVLSACASLASLPRFRVVWTRHLSETATFLRSLGKSVGSILCKTKMEQCPETLVTNCTECLQYINKIRKDIQARTTFPRMLMCIRGCSAPLAIQLASKYGSLLGLWRRLKYQGVDACDADPDIHRLTKPQKEVYLCLTKFILTRSYC